MFGRSTRMPTATEALPGRMERMPVPDTHHVNANRIIEPFPVGTQIALFADTIIASFLATGAVSALYYADRLNQLPIGVIGIAAGTLAALRQNSRLDYSSMAAAMIGISMPNFVLGPTLVLVFALSASAQTNTAANAPPVVLVQPAELRALAPQSDYVGRVAVFDFDVGVRAGADGRIRGIGKPARTGRGLGRAACDREQDANSTDAFDGKNASH